MVREYMNMDEVVAMAPRFEPEGWQRTSGMYQDKIATIYDVTRIVCLMYLVQMAGCHAHRACPGLN